MTADLDGELAETRHAITLRRYARWLEKSGLIPAFELLSFEADRFGTVTIGRWGGWLLQIVPTLTDDRIVLTDESYPAVYDYGWCYDKGGEAFLALIAWDLAQDPEPAGYTRRALPRLRKVVVVAGWLVEAKQSVGQTATG